MPCALVLHPKKDNAMSVIAFSAPKTRNDYIYKNIPYEHKTSNGNVIMMPCIALCEKETGIPIGFPNYERWYLRLVECEGQASSTLKKRADAVCCFLNFMLQETNADALHEITVSDLRGFLSSYKTLNDGTPRNHDSWRRGIDIVYSFLDNYWLHNKDNLVFGYTHDDLYRPHPTTGYKRYAGSAYTTNKFGITPPAPSDTRNRYLVEGYLPILLIEAQKYDRMIALGIALQAYAGLREGEIVNLTRSSIKRETNAYGRVTRIQIDLKHNADFSIERTGKSQFGSIKVKRKQEVYPTFNDDIDRLLNEHENALESAGFKYKKDAPLFVNKQGNPMSVTTYCQRLESLFMKRFLPALERVAEVTGEWEEYAPYIEAYSERYPGAHMLRHFFTMYLLTRTGLSAPEISRWRGDSSLESMTAYVHLHGQMISQFKNCANHLQIALVKDIL